MNQQIKKLWVDALRSGEYKQGINMLKDIDSNFCCLGVLCDLHSKHAPDRGVWEEGVNRDQTVSVSGACDEVWSGLYFDEPSTLPYAVFKWADLDHNDPVLEIEGVSDNISVLNDSGKVNFAQIADLIEEQL